MFHSSNSLPRIPVTLSYLKSEKAKDELEFAEPGEPSEAESPGEERPSEGCYPVEILTMTGLDECDGNGKHAAAGHGQYE